MGCLGKILMGVVIVAGISLFASENGYEEISEDNTEEMALESTKKENIPLVTFTDEELVKLNKFLSDSLSEDHDFAMSGDAEHQDRLYINGIEFEDDGRLIVYVEPDFLTLPEETRDNLANSMHGKGQLAILMALEDETGLEKDLYMSFRNSSEILGSSKSFGEGIRWKE